jgi:hypothetical protein
VALVLNAHRYYGIYSELLSKCTVATAVTAIGRVVNEIRIIPVAGIVLLSCVVLAVCNVSFIDE